MKYEIKTIDDFLGSVKEPEKEKYRLEFEAKKASGDKGKLESIVKKPYVSGKVYNNSITTSDAGEKYGVAVFDISVDKHGGNQGLTYQIAYSVADLEGEKVIHEFGPSTYRGGSASDSDNWKICYRDAKILEEKADGAVIGLKSSGRLEIAEYKKDGSKKVLESYNLEDEQKVNEKKEAIGAAINELDEQKIKDFMYAEYKSGSGSPSRIKKLSDNLAFVSMKYFDRSYDGKIEEVKNFLFVKGKGVIELGSLHFSTTHSGLPKYTMVEPVEKDFKFEEKNGRVTLSGIIEAEAIYNAGSGSSSYGVQDKKSFEYKIDLK
ncbi:MAG: hypothetical protein KJ583_02025 [Nanoarchaeota archaeon]|nr:hypothetical protein [Nanoarchaeota archaeon]MBU1270461.1 hypothetical protein [Nanoarchaeota archaeon]MBU1604071.1 hypothetical protein [Nanoarchaeota archaeon]MBU2442567.1 hypothetical protein [Nanoarchaeota archaeon]